MNCPRCRSLIVAEDVNLEHLLAKCRHCQEVFRFSVDEIEAVTDRVREREAITERPRREDRDEPLPTSLRVPRPANLFVEDWGPDRCIYKRWFEYQYLGMVVFCIFWDGFLVMWYSIAFAANGPWMMVLFPVIHVMVGVFMTYSTLAGLLNRTIIRVTENAVEVRHGPVPWLGNVAVPIGQIEQLYCTEASATWSNRRYMMPAPVQVNALMTNGGQQVILRSVPREEGLFIEHILEDWLGLKPQRIPGQVD